MTLDCLAGCSGSPWRKEDAPSGSGDLFHGLLTPADSFRMDADPRADSAGRAAGTRAGHIVLAGLPNAGKSTLLNALVGEHLSIVTSRAQTTWQRIAGIRTEGAAQMVFLDTPGIVASRELFHRSMMAETEGARRDADAAVGVVDGTGRPSPAQLDALLGFLARCRCPAALVVNKADHPRFDPGRTGLPERRPDLPAFVVSARAGKGLGPLLAFVRSRLPEGPFLYPENDLAAAPTRFFVQELVRETVFENFRQEIPYSVAVRVEEFREGEDPVYIAAALYVERKSQKGMLIGRGGAGIRALGVGARTRIEHLLGRRVYLDLWVRVWDGWKRKKEGLMKFGYGVPDDD